MSRSGSFTTTEAGTSEPPSRCARYKAAQQSDADADLLEPAFPHVGVKDFAEPRCRHGRRVDREFRHPPRLPVDGAILRNPADIAPSLTRELKMLIL